MGVSSAANRRARAAVHLPRHTRTPCPTRRALLLHAHVDSGYIERGVDNERYLTRPWTPVQAPLSAHSPTRPPCRITSTRFCRKIRVTFSNMFRAFEGEGAHRVNSTRKRACRTKWTRHVTRRLSCSRTLDNHTGRGVAEGANLCPGSTGQGAHSNYPHPCSLTPRLGTSHLLVPCPPPSWWWRC